jgi:Uma2 family endonuclease
MDSVPAVMTVAEFLACDAPGGGHWQLVDGEPSAMSPPSRTHEAIRSQLAHLIAGHLNVPGNPCSVITTPGIVPHVRANENFRIADPAVTCTRYETEEYNVSNPVLIVEILSPPNRLETWQNIWSFTTIPSVREILILSGTDIRAELLRRDSDGNWSSTPTVIVDGDLVLESIGLTVEPGAIYRTTRLARG